MPESPALVELVLPFFLTCLYGICAHSTSPSSSNCNDVATIIIIPQERCYIIAVWLQSTPPDTVLQKPLRRLSASKVRLNSRHRIDLSSLLMTGESLLTLVVRMTLESTLRGAGLTRSIIASQTCSGAPRLQVTSIDASCL